MRSVYVRGEGGGTKRLGRILVGASGDGTLVMLLLREDGSVTLGKLLVTTISDGGGVTTSTTSLSICEMGWGSTLSSSTTSSLGG